MLTGRVDDVAVGDDRSDFAENLQDFLLVQIIISFLAALVDHVVKLQCFAASRFRVVLAI